MRNRGISIALAVALVGTLLAVANPVGRMSEAGAANRNDFDPGNIISDAIFYDSSTMSAADIQFFLNQQVSSCAGGYTCLKDFRQSTPERAARAEGCSAIPAATDISAAEIIYRVAQSCGINPRVLLVLLQKEQSLVTSTAPSESRYRAATGYGCPDTAACDSTYYGFFNQVYNAARQFKLYRFTPNYWNYVAGRVNTILWHPNAGCGTSSVYIANQATAGLYIYTPYRPNDAALNNLYGTGDACSSYGNRNFWRIFTDWFGSTTLSNVMVRSTDSLQIWLLSGGVKYPINNVDVYNSLSPLGGVATVATSYLASLPNGREVSRFIGDTAGNLYLVDNGKRYHFDSCSRVTDWGFSCPNWTPLEDRIVSLIPSAGELSNVAKDSSQQYWQIIGGTRRQAVDASALAAVDGNPLTPVQNSTISALRIATPILRDDVVIKQSDAPNYWLNTVGAVNSLTEGMHGESALDTLPTRTLLPQSTALLTVQGAMSGVLSDGAGESYLLTETGKAKLASGQTLGLSTTLASVAILSALPTEPSVVGDPTFLRAVGTPGVYAMTGGSRHVINSWEDYVWLSSSASNPATYVIPKTTMAAIAEGGEYIRPGSIIRQQGTPAAYLVDGTSRLSLIQSYDITAQLGIGVVSREVSAASMGTFSIASVPLSRVVTCDGVTYLGVDGTLRKADSATQVAYKLGTSTALDATTCSNLTIGALLTPFVQKTSGAIYYMVDGTRRHIPNADVLAALGGNSGNLTAMSDVSTRDFPADVPLFSADVSERPAFLRGDGTPAVYIVKNGVRQVIQSWEDYLYAARGVTNPSINVSPRSVVEELPLGPTYIRPGMFVRPSNSPAVYLVDGASNLVVLGSIDPYVAVGGGYISVVPSADLTAYTQAIPNHLTSALTCDTTKYIGLGGNLYQMTADVVAQYGNPAATTLDPSTCDGLPQATGAPGKFILSPSGSVYLMDQGIKHPVRSPEAFLSLGGDWATLIPVSQYTVNLFATGSEVG